MISQLADKFVQAINPVAIAKNTAASTQLSVIDTLDANGNGKADYMTVFVYLGANDSGLSALALQSSNASGSGFATVTGLDYSASGQTLPGTTDTNKCWVFHVDLRGQKRYWKLALTTANAGTNGIVVAAWAVLSRQEAAAASALRRNVAYELFV